MDASRLLLVFLFGGLLAGGLRSPAAWTAVSAGVWLLLLHSREKASLSTWKAWGPWLAWALLSALLSAQPLKSLYPFARWAGLAAFFVLARSWWGERERRWWLAGLCAAGLILGLAALWTGRVDHWHLGEQMTGLIPPYYNYTAFVEAALASALIALLAHPQGPRGARRLGAYALLALMLLLILFARSRGALGGVIIAGVWTMLRAGQARRLALAAAVLAVAAAAVTAAMVFGRGASPAYLLKLDRVFARPQLWLAAADVARDHPIFGEGLGNFESGFLRHNFPAPFGIARYGFFSNYAHSELLQAAAETGWPGLALFILALAASIRLPRPGAGRPEPEAALAAAAAMGAQCLADNMLQIPALGMLFFSALACADPGAPNRDRGGKLAAALLGAGGLALALSAWVPSWLAGRVPPEQAVRIFPAEAALREDLARAAMTAAPPDPARALQELELASSLSPTNALYPVMRAELLRRAGDWGQVLALSELALVLEPSFLQARLLRAESLARLGRRGPAREELERARRGRDWVEEQRKLGRVGVGYEGMLAAFDPARFALVRNVIESGHG